MNPRVTLAVTTRVLAQLRRDHRTLVMLLVLPTLLMSLLWWMFADLPGGVFDRCNKSRSRSEPGARSPRP